MITIELRRPFQDQITVKTDCRQFASQLAIQYGQYARQGNRAADYTALRRAGGYYTVTYGGQTYDTESPLMDIHRQLFEHASYDRSVLALHGAAVAWKGRAVALLAATGSGKTTLTSYLTANGYGYLTDDCVLIDRETLVVYPSVTPLHLREGGVEVLRACRALPEKLTPLDEPAFRRYTYTPENCVTAPLPLAGICFIQRDTGNCMERMETTDAVTALLKSPITPYPMTSDHLRLMIRLAGLGCRRLHYADMDDVAEVLRRE